MEPKEHHRKTRLTKNEEMKDEDRARKSYGSLNCGPLGDAFGAMARAPALFFRLELADAIVYRITTAFVDFLFYFSIYRLVHVPTSINRKLKLKSTKAVVNL